MKKTLKDYLSEFAEDSKSPISGNNPKLKMPDKIEPMAPAPRKQYGATMGGDSGVMEEEQVTEDWGSSDWTAAINSFLRELDGVKTAQDLAYAALSTAGFYNHDRQFANEEWQSFSPKQLIRMTITRNQMPDELIPLAVQVLDGRVEDSRELDEEMLDTHVEPPTNWRDPVRQPSDEEFEMVRVHLLRRGIKLDSIGVDRKTGKVNWAGTDQLGRTREGKFISTKVTETENTKQFFKVTTPRAKDIVDSLFHADQLPSLEWHGDVAAADENDTRKLRGELIRRGAIDDFAEVTEDMLMPKTNSLSKRVGKKSKPINQNSLLGETDNEAE